MDSKLHSVLDRDVYAASPQRAHRSFVTWGSTTEDVSQRYKLRLKLPREGCRLLVDLKWTQPFLYIVTVIYHFS